MVTPERLRDLEFVADLWLKGQERSEKEFNDLIQLRDSARLTSANDVNVLNRRIVDADFAVREYKKAYTFASSLVDRAKSGEDV